MAKETKEVAESATATEATTKKVRRGIANARGTLRLKFSHEQAKPNGLFIAHLDSVVVKDILIGEDSTGMPSFNGLNIPQIQFTFASNEEEVGKRHYITRSFSAVESNANTIPGGKEDWKVNSIFDWIKHLLNVYVLRGRDLTEDEANALNLNFEDFDEQGEYVPVEPETVAAAWKVLFENVANIFNHGRDEQPYFKTKDGKNIPIWLKLVRYTRQGKKGWKAVDNGNLSLPTFVGEGVIEIYKQNVVPSIRLDIIKECITPKNVEETAKAPNMPTTGINMTGGVTPMGAMNGNNYTAITTEAADDMPF